MNNAHNSLCLCVFLLITSLTVNAAKNVAGVSGAISKTISEANASVPRYAVVSAGISADAVYSGQIASVTSNTISFESSSDSSEVTINPFVSGVFNTAVKNPILTPSLSGSGVGSISITYAGSGFSTAPGIIIDYPTSGDDRAFAVCTLNGSGGIASVVLKDSNGSTVSSSGSGYLSAPTATVVGGPHFVKLTESGDDDEGRIFLITDNNATRLTLDTSKLTSGESLSNVLQTDYSIEVVCAPTLGSVFGETASDLDLNPSSANGSASGADFVYLWNGFQYVPYAFMPSGSGRDAGWYSSNYMRWGRKNHLVIYPDEGFIVAKRTSGTLTLDFDGGVSTSDQKMQLPVTSGSVVMNNPYGTDMLLGELIPSETFGTSSVEFRPSVTLTPDDNADQLLFLVGVEWKQFFYKSGVNDGITKTATATARANSAGGGLADTDVSLASGTISNLQSCTASGGLSVNHNDSNHTLVTLSGTAPLVGFDITFKGIIGRKLNENGDQELDVNGTDVSNGSGIKIFSSLIGTYKIVARPSSSTVVVRKRRDINFVNAGTKTWSTGQGGTGYNGTAKAYFMGGGNTTMAIADATVSGGSVTGFDFSGTGNTRGAGYQYAPQVIISGGGWRKVGASDAIQDGEILEATEGIVIIRKNPGPDGNLGTSDDGKLTYFKPKNPFN
jgi:hypothetical protein